MDELRRISGLPFDDDRMAELLEAYRPIRAEIEKLRTLDLKEVYPAVRFDPAAEYRGAEAHDE